MAIVVAMASGAGAQPISDQLVQDRAIKPTVVAAQDVAQITEADIDAAFAELSSSDLPRTVTRSGGTVSTTFNLEGIDFTFTDKNRLAAGTNAATPQIGGGWDTRGLYVSFNTTEQQAIAAGATAALAAAICFIPGVGTVACVVAGVVIAVATTFLVANGICRGGKHLRIYPTSRTGRCV
ncbi:hypothetical protein AB6N23_02925 [Cellulomonas sp. 179-A 9B4 NHS]